MHQRHQCTMEHSRGSCSLTCLIGLQIIGVRMPVVPDYGLAPSQAPWGLAENPKPPMAKAPARRTACLANALVGPTGPPSPPARFLRVRSWSRGDHPIQAWRIGCGAARDHRPPHTRIGILVGEVLPASCCCGCGRVDTAPVTLPHMGRARIWQTQSFGQKEQGGSPCPDLRALPPRALRYLSV